MKTKPTKDRIRAERRIKGWTQLELAVECGLSSNCIAQIEQGKRQPRFETACKIAKALGVSVSDLS